MDSRIPHSTDTLVQKVIEGDQISLETSFSTPVFVLANFGGPRNDEEVYRFLHELLTDRDVIQTPFPGWLHRALFGCVAWCRSKYKVEEYRAMGLNGLKEKEKEIPIDLAPSHGPLFTPIDCLT